MPTNANTFNSRVTSEALEAKFRDVFPSQGGAELVQDLFASGVIQPVVDFSSVAEGSILPTQLQQAWDFATDHDEVINTTTTVINNTGFWLVNVVCYLESASSPLSRSGSLQITDGLGNKIVWKANTGTGTNSITGMLVDPADLIVFLRSGDSLTATSSNSDCVLNVSHRQIADVNGNLVNPLGFTFS